VILGAALLVTTLIATETALGLYSTRVTVISRSPR